MHIEKIPRVLKDTLLLGHGIRKERHVVQNLFDEITSKQIGHRPVSHLQNLFTDKGVKGLRCGRGVVDSVSFCNPESCV